MTPDDDFGWEPSDEPDDERPADDELEDLVSEDE